MEYQYYEFHSIDKPLSAKDRKEINSWSSRVNTSTNTAIFTYSYSDFPKDPFIVVEKYFDIMLYFANWGTKRLLFKIPANLLDFKQIAPFDCPHEAFYYGEGLMVQKKGNYIFIDISENEEEGDGWIDEDDTDLTPFISLRNDIINGDFRVLYLAWLNVISKRIKAFEKIEGEEKVHQLFEPPIPPNLKNLNETLKAFIDFWEIEKTWIQAAITKSLSEKEEKLDLEKALNLLDDKEKKQYLLRLANGEIHLQQKLIKFLKSKLGATNSNKNQNCRSVAQLKEIVMKMKK